MLLSENILLSEAKAAKAYHMARKLQAASSGQNVIGDGVLVETQGNQLAKVTREIFVLLTCCNRSAKFLYKHAFDDALDSAHAHENIQIDGLFQKDERSQMHMSQANIIKSGSSRPKFREIDIDSQCLWECF